MGATVKTTVIQAFAATSRAVLKIGRASCRERGLGSAGVILLTAMGAICGKPVLSTDQKDESNACVIALGVAAERFEEGKPEGNDEFITLTDVTIRTQSGAKFNFNTLTVFFDQIIAVSIGTLEN